MAVFCILCGTMHHGCYPWTSSEVRIKKKGGVSIVEAEVVYDGKYLHSSVISNMLPFVIASRA